MRAIVSVHRSRRQGLNWVATVIDKEGVSTNIVEESVGNRPDEAAACAITWAAKYNALIVAPREISALIPQSMLFTRM